MYVCLYVCMYVCMYACMYVCIHIYTHKHICTFVICTPVRVCVCVVRDGNCSLTHQDLPISREMGGVRLRTVTWGLGVSALRFRVYSVLVHVVILERLVVQSFAK